MVYPGVGADDGACCGGEFGLARGGQPAVPVEHARHELVHRPEGHHHRQLADRHHGCPNVAPGTGTTLCQAPSRAEAAVAAMTSASACASAMVELRCSPPAAATRNFLASNDLLRVA